MCSRPGNWIQFPGSGGRNNRHRLSKPVAASRRRCQPQRVDPNPLKSRCLHGPDSRQFRNALPRSQAVNRFDFSKGRGRLTLPRPLPFSGPFAPPQTANYDSNSWAAARASFWVTPRSLGFRHAVTGVCCATILATLAAGERGGTDGASHDDGSGMGWSGPALPSLAMPASLLPPGGLLPDDC
jgi:uncharacterized protein YceK